MLLCCLRRNVEATCHTLRRHLPPSTNTSAYQQIVSSTRHGLLQLSVLYLAFTARDGARYWLRIAISTYPPAFDTLIGGGGSRRNIAMTFGMEKLEWCGYPKVKNVWRYVHQFQQNPQTWQTDKHTSQTPQNSIGHTRISSHSKKTMNQVKGQTQH